MLPELAACLLWWGKGWLVGGWFVGWGVGKLGRGVGGEREGLTPTMATRSMRFVKPAGWSLAYF